MTAICPKSGRPITVAEGQSTAICPGCARPVLVAAGRIRDHHLPSRQSAGAHR